MSTKKRQRQQHDELWNLFVQACGGKCCVCGGADSKLQRGHIQRHTDGGGDDLSNLIPVCKPCNGRFNKALLTPDGRPADWKSRFVKLLIQHFGLGIKWHATYPSGAPPNPNASIENTKVIPLEELVFEPDSSYLPTTTTPTTPTPDQIVTATDEIVRLGKNQNVSIPPPTAQTLDKMHRLAQRYGLQTFLAVGSEFLTSADWFDVSGDMVTRLMRGQEWERFCANFSLYRSDLRQRIANEAKEAEDSRKLAEEMRQQEEAQRQLEQDPEYQRQQAEKRMAAAKDGAQRRRDLKVDRLVRQFLDTAHGIELDDDDEKTRAYYEGKNLLSSMRTCPEDELVRYAESLNQLMRILDPNS